MQTESIEACPLSYEEPRPAEMERTIAVHLSASDLDALTYALDHVLSIEPDLLPATNIDASPSAGCDVDRLKRLLELQSLLDGVAR